MKSHERNDEPTETRKEQLTAALNRLALELCALDIHFATVLYDELAQDKTSITISFAGNVSMEGADALFERFIKSHTDPKSTTTTKMMVERATFDPAIVN